MGIQNSFCRRGVALDRSTDNQRSQTEVYATRKSQTEVYATGITD